MWVGAFNNESRVKKWIKKKEKDKEIMKKVGKDDEKKWGEEEKRLKVRIWEINEEQRVRERKQVGR